jgi:hypothetical protein
MPSAPTRKSTRTLPSWPASSSSASYGGAGANIGVGNFAICGASGDGEGPVVNGASLPAKTGRTNNTVAQIIKTRKDMNGLGKVESAAGSSRRFGIKVRWVSISSTFANPLIVLGCDDRIEKVWTPSR